MYINYDEYELLELFESEPISIAEEEAGMFIYSKIDEIGLKLVMTISIYENECSISLNLDEKTISEIAIKNVKALIHKENSLIIQKSSKNNIDDIFIRFKPNFKIIINNI